MIKLFNLMLLLILCGSTVTVSAVQTCRTESQIPASTPTIQFIDHEDGTLTDTKSSLMWSKCAEGLYGSNCATGSATWHNWQAALELANASTLAGYSDWRLPNINELHSIVEEQCYNPAINLSVFPNTSTLGFWSALPHVDFFSGSAWDVDFGYGSSSDNIRSGSRHVRLVRGGQ